MLILLVLAIVIVLVDHRSGMGHALLSLFKGVIGLAVIGFIVATILVVLGGFYFIGLNNAVIRRNEAAAHEAARYHRLPHDAASSSSPQPSPTPSEPPVPPRPLFRGRLPGPAMSTHSTY